MDQQIIFIIILLIIYGISIYVRRVIIPKAKGKIGEYKVSRKLKKLSSKDYIILNDILIKSGNSTSQIDHIVVSRNGIFVIETKNYKGWIHGHEKSENWKQTIYNKKYKLINPIKQNWVHVLVLKQILYEYNYIKYHPIVVFSGSAKLKNITSSLPVIKTRKLLKTIRNNDNVACLTLEQMNSISDKLSELNLTSRKDKRSHVKQVKKRNKKYKKKLNSLECPMCRGKLIAKNGKYGKFYGCSNFPECRYSKKY